MCLLTVRWPRRHTSGTSSAAAFISSGSYAASGDHYQQTLAEPWLLHSSPVEIDYCNGVLYGVSSQVIRRLQMVLNAAARLVVGVGRYEHIPPRPLATWFIATTNIVQDSNLCVWLWRTRHVARNYEGGSPPPPLSFPPFALPPPLPLPSLRSRHPLNQLGGLGERYKLPQNRFWCILASKSGI